MSKRKKKKNRNLGPRRKRMRRPARLLAAVTWRARYGRQNPVRGYARWFGVDLICAITELRMLGVAVDPEYEARSVGASPDRTSTSALRARSRAIESSVSTEQRVARPRASVADFG